LEIIIDPIQEYDRALSKEWIVTNGLGGYASSSILGINTRRYHGLLVIPFGDPPFQRRLLLPKVDESIIGEGTVHLSSNEYPGVIYPEGYRHFKRFSLDPLPVFISGNDDFSVKKTVFMPHHRNAVVMNYLIERLCDEFTEFQIRIFINHRSLNSLTREGMIEFEADSRGESLVFRLPGSDRPFLIVGSDLMVSVPTGAPVPERWYRDFVYRVERERGYEFMEDHYSPGVFKIQLDRRRTEFNLLATGGPTCESVFEELYAGSRDHLRDLRRRAVERSNIVSGMDRREEAGLSYLRRSADSFLSDGRVVAGYHWFGCWGRDTLISLPGLTLVTGRHKQARRILLDVADRIREGLVPNLFDERSVDYNCFDASLLYIYALHKYLSYTDDLEMAKSLWNPALRIFESCLQGLNDGVSVDGGLVWSDRSTWMDVRVDGRPVTPRKGKAVEIQALWYNALRSMDKIGERIGESFPFVSAAEDVERSFLSEFWNEERACLYDVVGDVKDASIRPNQIFAVSLPFSLLAGEFGERLVQTVREKLLTPYGLRTLSEDDPEYRGRYCGSPLERDLSYHQGTVWSWLLGPFITAFIRTGGKRSDALSLLDSLLDEHLREAGVGTVSEIFDGNPPHLPRGCISQAWSVAEILRCYVEDIRKIRPVFEDRYGVS